METKPFRAPPRCDATHPNDTAVQCVKEATRLHAEHRGYLVSENGAREPVSWPNEDHQQLIATVDEMLSGSGQSVLDVRPATLDDMEAVVAIVEAEADDSTSERHCEHEAVAHFVEQCVRRDEVLLAAIDGTGVGMLALTDRVPRWWIGRPGAALYVVALIAHPAVWCEPELLDTACDQAALAGRDRLRVDCTPDEVPYYVRFGFEHRGDLETDEGLRSLLELPVPRHSIESAEMTRGLQDGSISLGYPPAANS
jgi:hypothetical protein